MLNLKQILLDAQRYLYFVSSSEKGQNNRCKITWILNKYLKIKIRRNSFRIYFLCHSMKLLVILGLSRQPILPIFIKKKCKTAKLNLRVDLITFCFRGKICFFYYYVSSIKAILKVYNPRIQLHLFGN